MKIAVRMPGLMLAALMMPMTGVQASPGVPLDQLACAAGVYCNAKITSTDAQVVLNLTEQQAQAAFIEASQDWTDAHWRCAAGGRTCGHVSQSDMQVIIGLPEEAYGPAEQLRERGVPSETKIEPVAKSKPAAPKAAKPGIVVETLPPAGPGAFKEVTMPGAGTMGDIQPLDGRWTFTSGSSKAAGCMAGIAQSLPKQMAPQSGQVAFKNPFQPNQILNNESITWRRVGPNQHTARLTKGGDAMVMSWDLGVETRSMMRGNSKVTVRIPGQPVCTITTPFVYQRQGS